MALQEKAIDWLRSRTDEDIQDILADICETKGIVSAIEYSKILCIPERSVYDGIKSGKIKTFTFIDRKFPYINL